MRGRPVTFKATRAPQTGMTYDAALKLLNLKPTYDVAAIKTAFAQRVKEFHPDTAAPEILTVFSIKQLKEARDVLVEAAAELNRACKLCRGAGRVRGAMGLRKCGACNGTGDKQ